MRRVLMIVTAVVLLMLLFPMTAAGAETTNVTIRVNEYIVLDNDIHIELIEVGADMGWYARVHFYSYRDSVGKTETLYQGDTWPASYTSGTGRTIDVALDSAFPNGASFVIESSKGLRITERQYISAEVVTSPAVVMPTLSIELLESPVVGEELTITVTSGGIAVEGAEVTFDGTKLSGLTDSSGEIRFTPEEASTFTITASKERHLTANSKITVSVSASLSAISTPTEVATPVEVVPTGRISVSSSPSGAYIYLDGAYKGTTPATISDASPGSHTLKLEKYGYKEWLTSVHVASGVTKSITAHLTAADVSPPAIRIDKPVTIEYNSNGLLEEGEKVTIIYGATDPTGVASIKILLDETLLESQNQAGTYTVTTDPLTMGRHIIRVVAIDSKSNRGSEELPITVERTGPSVYFGTTRTTINKGEDAIFTLSAVNPIGNPPMTVQLILKPPTGVSVTSTSFAKAGSGIYTCTHAIESGDNVRSIEVRLTGNQAGTHEIESEVYYQFEGSPKSPTRYEMLTLVVDDHDSMPPTSTPKPSPGFAAVVAVIGLLAVYLRRKRI